MTPEMEPMQAQAMLVRYGNKMIYINGLMTFMMVILSLSLISFGWLSWSVAQDAIKATTQEHKHMVEALKLNRDEIVLQQKAVTASLNDLNESVEVQNYILTAPKEEVDRIREKQRRPPAVRKLLER